MEKLYETLLAFALGINFMIGGVAYGLLLEIPEYWVRFPVGIACGIAMGLLNMLIASLLARGKKEMSPFQETD